MKPILTILIISLALNASAQKIRFTDTTNQWMTRGTDGGGDDFKCYLHYGNATVLYGKVYRPLINELFGGIYYALYRVDSEYLIREDTTAGMVYYRVPSNDTIEHLLYNYNMNIGDSITYIELGSFYTDTIAAIDSTIINGVYHKVFTMAGATGPAFSIVEGVGSTVNPISPAYYGCFENFEQLICFLKNGTAPAFNIPYTYCNYGYFSHPDYYYNCSLVSVEKVSEQAVVTSITPNPATDHIDITSDHPFAPNTFITVYDIGGRCVFRTQAEQQNVLTVSTASWVDGLYMVIVQDNTGIIAKEKVVIVR